MFAANHKTCKHIIYNHLLPGRWLHRKLMPTEIRGLNPKETDSSSSASEITSFYLMNILTVQLTPEQRDLSCMGAPICRVFSANNRRSTTWPMAGWIHRREITDTRADCFQLCGVLAFPNPVLFQVNCNSKLSNIQCHYLIYAVLLDSLFSDFLLVSHCWKCLGDNVCFKHSLPIFRKKYKTFFLPRCLWM